MATVTVKPAYPVPGRECELVFELTESGTNFVRVWVTIAPDGSEFEQSLTNERTSRLEIYAGGGGADFPFRWNMPDKGGKYTFVAQEYTKGSSVGGAFQGDTRGAPSETKVGSEATLTVYVGQRLTQRLGAGEDTATLIVWVWDDTIRATTFEVQGEVTPVVDPASLSTERARTAAGSSSVLAAVAALAGVSVTTAIGAMSSLVPEFVTRWNLHVANATVHGAADAANPVPSGLASATLPTTLKEFVNAALLALGRHLTNDSGTGVDTGSYHALGSEKMNDWASKPVVQSVNSIEEAYAGFADLHRCYEAHRASVTSITHVASQAQSSLAATTSATTTIPTCAVGDVLIFPVVNRDATAAPSVTDNDTGGNLWARVDTGSDGLTVWWKRATAATSGKTITASGATGSIASGVSVFRGCRTTGDPFENAAKEANGSGNETHAAITPTQPNAHVVLIVANRSGALDTSAHAATAPAVLTERFDVLNTGGNDCSVALASALRSGAGATGALTWAQTDAASISCAFNLLAPVGGVHIDSDPTALTALPALLSLHRAFFAVLADNAPAPPLAQSSGAVLLVQQAGFAEA